jgi:hypothetical protein
MKNILHYSIILLIMFSCCNNNHDELPGTYIRFAKHEFGVENDTLRITTVVEHTIYKLERRWRYERVIDGQQLEPEYKVKVTTLIYDGQHLLREEETWTLFTLDKNVLYNGTTKYKRI